MSPQNDPLPRIMGTAPTSFGAPLYGVPNEVLGAAVQDYGQFTGSQGAPMMMPTGLLGSFLMQGMAPPAPAPAPAPLPQTPLPTTKQIRRRQMRRPGHWWMQGMGGAAMQNSSSPMVQRMNRSPYPF